MLVAYFNLVGWFEHFLAFIEVNGKTTLTLVGTRFGPLNVVSFWGRDFVFKLCLKV